MAEVMNAPVDNLDCHRDRRNNNNNKEAGNTSKSLDGGGSSPAPPPLPPQPQARRGRDRERDSRERRDDWEFDSRGRDYYDRNRSPPPHRERDYNKRGRPKPSPPPSPYCDRRGGGHSPPARRSPPFPPYKRPRRDYHDGKRGSLRGGYGPGDRRFYDYQARHNREMGGSPSYPDERFHGRFFGRSSGGNQDWDSGHGAVADGFGVGGTQREGLMSYKQFVQELDDDILPSEAEGRYQEYKLEYILTQKRTYFYAHKDEEWLKDRYHPTHLLSVIERRNEAARKLAKDFLLDLQSGRLDLGPGFNASFTNKSGQSSDPNSDEELDTCGKRRRHGKGPTKETDLLSAAPKAPLVSSEARRIQIDIEQAQALVRKLDSEKGIEENLLCGADNEMVSRDKSHGGSTGPVIIIRGLTSVKSLEGIELLDTLLTYLWRVHGVDYYGMLESSEAKGLRHVRVDGKTLNASNTGAEWEKKLDLRWQERLKGQDPLEGMTAKEKIDAAAVEARDPYVRKIRDEKYRWKYGCGVKGCTNLFHAAEFVHRHLKLKHPELVMEHTSKVLEDLYFQNYMNDESSPGGIPIMQPSILKEKLLRHRLWIK